MAKKPFNVQIPAELDAEFRRIAGEYASKREVWVPAAAALRMFIRSSAQDQAAAVLAIRRAEVSAGMDKLVAEARQASKTETAIVAEASRSRRRRQKKTKRAF